MLQWVVLLFCIFEYYYYNLEVCLIIVFYVHNNIYFQLYSFPFFLTYFVLRINLSSKICKFINAFKLVLSSWLITNIILRCTVSKT